MRAPADRWAGGVWTLVLLVVGGAVAAQTPLAADSSTDQAIADLLEENPRLSDLVRRDHTLLDVLGDNPAMTARLAARPALLDRVIRAISNPWVVFGFAAQFVFAMRFIIQWIASERRRRSYVPVAFWYLSICGGLMLLTYAIQRRDPVFMAGQSLGVFIYVRNLVLIHRRAGDYRDVTADRGAAADATALSEAADANPAEPSAAG